MAEKKTQEKECKKMWIIIGLFGLIFTKKQSENLAFLVITMYN